MALPENRSTLAKRPVKDVYAVSRLVREARAVLEGGFPLLWVEGEISNLAMPASGHIYFTLKDEVAQVRCAMFKGRNRQLRFVPENGMQALLRVRVTLYEGRGEFQLVVEHMEEAGSGALQRAYEALKQRLGEAGLFDEAHKKPLPAIPSAIGIVSSPDGAAVHDILTVLKRRFPGSEVIIYPAAVQGQGSAEQIVHAIETANQRQDCEVLIVGRGGGSIEDLWSFNEEKVARAIFDSELPVISAVGHEIDFTIADFVADVRAATPSAAAELAVPDAMQWRQKINEQARRLAVLIRHRLQNEQRHLSYLRQQLTDPKQMIYQQMQRLDQLEKKLNLTIKQGLLQRRQTLDYWSARLKQPQAAIAEQRSTLHQLSARLKQVMSQQLMQHQLQYQGLQQRLVLQSPKPQLVHKQSQLSQLQSRLDKAITSQLQSRQSTLKQLTSVMSAVSPLSTLERGYSIASDSRTGQVLRQAEQVQVGQRIDVKLQHGQLECEVKDKNND